jgi:predicted RNA-binding protein YlxR (DUF448 family)
VTRRADGSLVVSRTAPGRGAWLCASTASACAAAAAKRRAWSRALRSDPAGGAVDALQRHLAELEPGVGADRPQR